MIPGKSNIRPLDLLHGVAGTRAYAKDGLADFSSQSGSIPVAYDNGNNLPNYEDSLYESAEFKE
jgi:hypothetical protein